MVLDDGNEGGEEDDDDDGDDGGAVLGAKTVVGGTGFVATTTTDGSVSLSLMLLLLLLLLLLLGGNKGIVNDEIVDCLDELATEEPGLGRAKKWRFVGAGVGCGGVGGCVTGHDGATVDIESRRETEDKDVVQEACRTTDKTGRSVGGGSNIGFVCNTV